MEEQDRLDRLCTEFLSFFRDERSEPKVRIKKLMELRLELAKIWTSLGPHVAESVKSRVDNLEGLLRNSLELSWAERSKLGTGKEDA